MNSTIQLNTLALLLLSISIPVLAQASDDYHPLLTKKFHLAVGVYWPAIDYTLRVDGTVPEEEIDFDQALNIDDYQATAAIDFRWRFGKKWSFEGQYWDTSTDGGGILKEDTEWEDLVFKEGTFAHAGIDIKVARAFFGRAFSTSPKHEFGAGIGLHWMEIGSFLEGEVIINDDTTDFRRATVDASFPLPNIGAWYMYSWSPKWIFFTRADWLSASIGNYSGSLWDVQAGFNYQAFKNVGFGLSYMAYLVNIDVDKTDWRGGVEMNQYGPVLSVTATW